MKWKSRFRQRILLICCFFVITTVRPNYWVAVICDILHGCQIGRMGINKVIGDIRAKDTLYLHVAEMFFVWPLSSEARFIRNWSVDSARGCSGIIRDRPFQGLQRKTWFLVWLFYLPKYVNQRSTIDSNPLLYALNEVSRREGILSSGMGANYLRQMTVAKWSMTIASPMERNLSIPILIPRRGSILTSKLNFFGCVRWRGFSRG